MPLYSARSGTPKNFQFVFVQLLNLTHDNYGQRLSPALRCLGPVLELFGNSPPMDLSPYHAKYFAQGLTRDVAAEPAPWTHHLGECNDLYRAAIDKHANRRSVGSFLFCPHSRIRFQDLFEFRPAIGEEEGLTAELLYPARAQQRQDNEETTEPNDRDRRR